MRRMLRGVNEGLFEAACACNVVRRGLVIYVSSAVRIGWQREGETWPLRGRCRPCGNEGGRGVGGEACKTKRKEAERIGLGGHTEGHHHDVVWQCRHRQARANVTRQARAQRSAVRLVVLVSEACILARRARIACVTIFKIKTVK